MAAGARSGGGEAVPSRYLAQRVALSAGALWLVATATFFLLHAIPGDPFSAEHIGRQTHALLVARYGLDLPLWRQYLRFLNNVLHGRLGWSLVDPQRSVWQIIAQGFPVSGVLGLEALGWSVSGGIALGVWSAARPRGAVAALTLGATLAGLAVPNFVWALLLDWLVGARWQLLPVAGWGGVASTILPAVSLGMVSLALVTRLIRARTLGVLTAQYVRTARAAGLPERRILWHHVLRNAALPVLAVIGPMAAAVLTGSFAIEQVFSLPGLGQAYVQSVLDRDYPLVLGLTLFYAALLLTFNLLADLAYPLLDPRVRLGGRQA